MSRPWGTPPPKRDVALEVYGWGIVAISYLFLFGLVLAGAWLELG